MSEPNTNPNTEPTPAPVPETPAEKTFTQTELDTIVGKRIAKAMKGMPGEAELSEFRTWKASQQTEKERWDTLTAERDTAKTELTAAQAELEQYKREKFLLSKGVPAEDVDYYAFKIGKQVTDSVDFEKAAELFLKDNPPAGTVRVDLTAPVGGSNTNRTASETMNSLIRGARK